MAALRSSARLAAPLPRAALRLPARRAYATSPAPGAHPPPQQGGSRAQGTSKMLIGSVALLGAAGGAFLLFGPEEKRAALGVGPDGSNKLSGAKAQRAATYKGVGPGLAADPADYQKVYNAIAEKLDSNPEYDDGSYGPVLVRLAWHASGTYDKDSNTGGSNGATMRFAPEANHGANAGLIVARNFMDEIHEQFPWISYSDLWTLGGIVAVQELGGPKVQWRPGRKDGEEAHCTPDGRLPDGDKGSDHLRHIFYRMGFNDQEIVALSGAHALGRCHKDRSGFDGPWQHAPTSFTNAYYELLFSEKWNLKKWDGPIQYEDKNTKSLMMLTTDYALRTDKSFRKHAERYAKSEDEFFKDFSAAFGKLLELGVPEVRWQEGSKLLKDGKHLTFQTTAEQENAQA